MQLQPCSTWSRQFDVKLGTLQPKLENSRWPISWVPHWLTLDFTHGWSPAEAWWVSVYDWLPTSKLLSRTIVLASLYDHFRWCHSMYTSCLSKSLMLWFLLTTWYCLMNVHMHTKIIWMYNIVVRATPYIILLQENIKWPSMQSGSPAWTLKVEVDFKFYHHEHLCAIIFCPLL